MRIVLRTGYGLFGRVGQPALLLVPICLESRPDGIRNTRSKTFRGTSWTVEDVRLSQGKRYLVFDTFNSECRSVRALARPAISQDVGRLLPEPKHSEFLSGPAKQSQKMSIIFTCCDDGDGLWIDTSNYQLKNFNPAPVNNTSNATASSDAPAIVGGTAGGVAGLLLVLGLVWFLWRRRRSTKKK